MTLVQLRYFIEVAQTQNLLTAASRLYISQSSLSRNISQLEHELGFALFQRTNRGVQLTTDGLRFLRTVEQPYSDFIRSIHLATSSGQNRTVRIAIPQEQQLSDELLNMLCDKNLSDSKVRISIFSESSDNMLAQLRTGEYDLLITDKPDVKEAQGIAYANLFELRSVLAFSERHPNAKKERLSLTDFSDEYFFIAMNENSLHVHQSAEYIEEEFGFAPKFLYTGNTSSTLLNVVSGLGVAILPDIYIRSDMSRLRTIPVEALQPQWCSLAWRKDENDPNILSLIRDIKKLSFT